MQNLYLHIGRGKTGTTAIQRFLSAHREGLRAQGLHYVEADDTAQMGHQDFAKSFIHRAPSYMKMPAHPERSRAAVRAELVSSASPNGLLSSENFTLADIPELADFFARSLGGAKIKIIFFARSQDELAESQYNQMVKLALCAKTFEEYIATELDELDFPALLDPWAAHFGKDNIIARVYDGTESNVIQDFLGCLPLSFVADAGPDEEAPSSNPSVGYLALQIFRVLNRFEFPAQRALYEQLNETVKPIDLPPLFFNSAEARAFRDRFRSSNQFFIREYQGGRGDDLGGRKYSDAERDRIYHQIQKLRQSSGTDFSGRGLPRP